MVTVVPSMSRCQVFTAALARSQVRAASFRGGEANAARCAHLPQLQFGASQSASRVALYAIRCHLTRTFSSAQPFLTWQSRSIHEGSEAAYKLRSAWRRVGFCRFLPFAIIVPGEKPTVVVISCPVFPRL